MTLAKPEGVDPKYLKLSYQAGEGPVSRRDLLFGPLTPRYEVVPAVEAEACAAWKGCAQCFIVCPQQAIAMDGSAAAIDKAKCIGCGACLPVCPVGAIRQPLLNPERLEAELRALFLSGEVTLEPRILLLVADGGLVPDEPNNVRSLRLPSIGAVSPWLLLRAFTLGADGIAILPCQSGCRHRCDQARWDHTLSFTRELLARFGEADRLLVVGREETGRQREIKTFGEAVAVMRPHRLRSKAGPTSNGTPSLSDILRNLAALAPSQPPPLVGDGTPFGMVRVQANRCTLCGACPERCPTGALKLQEDSDSSRLLFDHARCVACEACVRVCPEGAVEMERRLEVSRLGRSAVLAEDQMVRCQSCGAAIAPQSMLRKVQSAVGRGAPWDRFCPACRMLQSLARVRG
jgi:ferredoxin